MPKNAETEISNFLMMTSQSTSLTGNGATSVLQKVVHNCDPQVSVLFPRIRIFGVNKTRNEKTGDQTAATCAEGGGVK
jgi:hypothetical protein